MLRQLEERQRARILVVLTPEERAAADRVRGKEMAVYTLTSGIGLIEGDEERFYHCCYV